MCWRGRPHTTGPRNQSPLPSLRPPRRTSCRVSKWGVGDTTCGHGDPTISAWSVGHVRQWIGFQRMRGSCRRRRRRGVYVRDGVKAKQETHISIYWDQGGRTRREVQFKVKLIFSMFLIFGVNVVGWRFTYNRVIWIDGRKRIVNKTLLFANGPKFNVTPRFKRHRDRERESQML